MKNSYTAFQVLPSIYSKCNLLLWILFLLFFLGLYHPCIAQYYEISLQDKASNSEVVVEGKIKDVQCFQNNGSVFTSCKIEVYNYFPLNESKSSQSLIPEYLYIILRGGSLGGYVEHWSHELNLIKGDIGLFFLTSTNRPILYTDYTSYEVYSGPQGYVKYSSSNDVFNFSASDVFNFYDNPETDLLEPILQNSINGYQDEKSFIREKWMLVFNLYNFQIIGDYVHFDVGLKSRWSNLFSIDSLYLDFSYDGGVFGTNPLVDGEIDFTASSFISSHSHTMSVNQNSSNSIRVNLTKSAFTGVDFSSMSFQNLFTIKLKASALNLQNFVLPFSISEGYISIYNEDGNIVQSTVESIIKNELGSFATCAITGSVSSVIPGNVGAGVLRNETFVNVNSTTSGIVTISGCGFDDLDEETLCEILPGGSNGYRVEFREFSGDWVTPICTEYIKWDDDEIIVRVPSVGYRVNYFFGIPSLSDLSPSFFAATGNVRVITSGANPDGSEEVTIDFVHRNDVKTIDGITRAIRALLKGKDSDFKGYELYFTEAFTDKFGASGQNAFIRALDEWKCKTLVNFEIKSLEDITNSAFACAIDYGIVGEGTQGDTRILAFTPSDPLICTPFESNQSELTINSFQLIFSNDDAIEWHTSMSDVPSGKVDLQTVALHELGHAIQLFHVRNEGAVMEPLATRQRRELTASDVNGGIHVVQASNQAAVCPSPMIPISPCIVGTDEVFVSEIEIIPNPTYNKFRVLHDISLDKTEIRQLVLLSADGKIVYRNELREEIEHEIDISNFPAGVYFVLLQTSSQVFTQKLVKQ